MASMLTNCIKHSEPGKSSKNKRQVEFLIRKKEYSLLTAQPEPTIGHPHHNYRISISFQIRFNSMKLPSFSRLKYQSHGRHKSIHFCCCARFLLQRGLTFFSAPQIKSGKLFIEFYCIVYSAFKLYIHVPSLDMDTRCGPHLRLGGKMWSFICSVGHVHPSPVARRCVCCGLHK